MYVQEVIMVIYIVYSSLYLGLFFLAVSSIRCFRLLF